MQQHLILYKAMCCNAHVFVNNRGTITGCREKILTIDILTAGYVMTHSRLAEYAPMFAHKANRIVLQVYAENRIFCLSKDPAF
jgi:hypothetical protein